METKEQKIERLKKEIDYFKRIIDDCINKYGFSKDSFLIEYYKIDIEQREQELKELEDEKHND
ncbi:MAG: hypothetical protein II598_05150 [Elusimicrobia bacterium]|nr:hypothetical protein [Elusimicrobiota bacterium]